MKRWSVAGLPLGLSPSSLGVGGSSQSEVGSLVVGRQSLVAVRWLCGKCPSFQKEAKVFLFVGSSAIYCTFFIYR